MGSEPGTLLLHPPPGEGELFSSWINRVAQSNLLRLPTLLLALGCGRVLKRDLDLSTSDETLRALAAVTRQPPERVLATTLRPMLARLHGEVSTDRPLAFLVTLGRMRGVTQERGHPVCLDCLAENGRLRRTWRLTTTVVCERHGVRLTDVCPGCAQPISLLRPQMAQATRKHAPLSAPANLCPKCRTWMRSSPLTSPELLETALVTQRLMEEAVTTGRVSLPDLSIPAADFKDLLAVLQLQVVHRNEPAEYLTFPPAFRTRPFVGKAMLEYASPDVRLPVMARLGLLLWGGLSGLFTALTEADIGHKELLLGRQYTQQPRWLNDLIHDALSRRPNGRQLTPVALKALRGPVSFSDERWTAVSGVWSVGPGDRAGHRKGNRQALGAFLTRSLNSTPQREWEGETSYLTFSSRLLQLQRAGQLDLFLGKLIVLLEQALGGDLPGDAAHWSSMDEETRTLLLALLAPATVSSLSRVGSMHAAALRLASLRLSIIGAHERLVDDLN